MKLNELISNRDYRFGKVECIHINNQGKKIFENGTVEYDSGEDLKLITNSGCFRFNILSNQKNIIIDYLKRGFCNVCRAESANDENRFYLEIVFFSSSVRFGECNILLSERVKDILAKKHLIRSEPFDKFADEFMLDTAFGKCFAFTDGVYRINSEVSDDDDKEDDENEEAQDTNKNIKNINSLKIYGKNCTLFVEYNKDYGKNGRLVCNKVVFRVSNTPCMRLGTGIISFDSEKAFVSNEVRSLLDDNPGYLKLWDQYAQLEGELQLRRARDIGVIYFDSQNTSFEKKCVIITLPLQYSEALKKLSENDMMFGGVVPCYIENSEMTWKEYMEVDKKNEVRGVPYKISRIDGNNIYLETENLPKPPLTLSILGEEKQIRRRENARLRIANGECANPRLGLVIEGIENQLLGKVSTAKKYDSLSAYVKEKIFYKNPPTDVQRQAIDIALNTPDIAVIQGPPGTGKTTVIKAIIERLNELTDKKNVSSGNVLVTSLQHDAVYNISRSLSINGMPTIKFGKKARSDDDALQKWEIDAGAWCRELSLKLREKNPQLSKSINQGELDKIYKTYLVFPSDEKAKELLLFAKTLCSNSEILHKIDAILLELENESSDVDINNIIKKIRMIRVTEEGFCDDGANNALILFDALENMKGFDRNDKTNASILKVLRVASDCIDTVPDGKVLKNLAKVKNILLERCIPKPFYRVPSVRQDITQLIPSVIESLESFSDEKDKILRDLVHELDHSSSTIISAVQSYSFVFAATAQQSLGKDVYKAKNKNEYPSYDTVIVDEAARVAPGDLMIPLSQAKRRVILVGDHRQLPHIYKEEIFEEMSSQGDSIDENDIKESMFQHLWKSAKKLEKSDGIVRTVTLDKQYRTHPLLGDFASDCFYKAHGEAYSSPLGAEYFEQPIYEKPLVWVDIPRKYGSDKKMGTSRYREAEIDYIAKRLEEYLMNDDYKKLTFGVITFYSAQVSVLKRKLGKLSENPRIYIGSVDAFQGMEFDVVFLSVVRTASKAVSIDDPEEFDRDVSHEDEDSMIYKKHSKYIDTIGKKYYGFLTSENRLCVALSRQKKLLIVVGDSGIFIGDEYSRIAQKCVPTMQKLYYLAESEGIIVHGDAT